MHELSLALEVCRLADEVRLRERGSAVRSLGVDVGDDAGIELENFRFCLDALLLEPPFVGARAELTPVSGDVLRLTFVEVDDGRPDD
ncbi:MAG TPA: hydrogenase/urease maturation nickel metallochaperone HypA [Gemmatimonadales bacterium]|nr:hydrogenase/urease maturation nickel metallochaperone HypA [Gemmatimonadales bacterium]